MTEYTMMREALEMHDDGAIAQQLVNASLTVRVDRPMLALLLVEAARRLNEPPLKAIPVSAPATPSDEHANQSERT